MDMEVKSTISKAIRSSFSKRMKRTKNIEIIWSKSFISNTYFTLIRKIKTGPKVSDVHEIVLALSTGELGVAVNVVYEAHNLGGFTQPMRNVLKNKWATYEDPKLLDKIQKFMEELLEKGQEYEGDPYGTID